MLVMVGDGVEEEHRPFAPRSRESRMTFSFLKYDTHGRLDESFKQIFSSKARSSQHSPPRLYAHMAYQKWDEACKCWGVRRRANRGRIRVACTDPCARHC